MDCRILLTGFYHTSAEELILSAYGCDTLLLPSDKKKDGRLLVTQLVNKQYDLVICVGQRPNIKNKVHIETSARENGIVIRTTFDCEKLADLFKEHGLHAKISHNAGTSYCNALYWNGLQFIAENHLDTRIVFVHIPFYKNLCDPALFKKCFFEVIDELKAKGVYDLWTS